MNWVWAWKTREAISLLYVALAAQLELLVHHCTFLAAMQLSFLYSSLHSAVFWIYD